MSWLLSPDPLTCPRVNGASSIHAHKAMASPKRPDQQQENVRYGSRQRNRYVGISEDDGRRRRGQIALAVRALAPVSG